ncbi:MAG: radical SAM family heme chaperone HemW [Pseudohongiellaceae bacterium]|nr:radical SAM family heme chaperone HemW [Pseudohongiellaceae bacterium]
MMSDLSALPPLSLYIHIPWCVRKCPYCDFNSHQKNAELPEKEYIAALLQDFALDSAYIQGRELQSIFIGGGTPSLFSAKAYREILSGLQSHISFATDIEITLEANPGTAERERFAHYREAGINRLSIGVQSFDELQLHNLGRIHSGDDALKAVEFAKAAGFDNFNLDIMYGLKKQSPSSAMQDLEKAIACEPTHLSWYQLTIEPNTEFFKRPPPLPNEDTLIEIQDTGLQLLRERGYDRYEISAFAKSGRQSRHNLNYWRFGDYIGIGAGAHGKLSSSQNQEILRTRKRTQPKHYLEAHNGQSSQFTAQRSPINADEITLEFMLNVLRLAEGFTPQQYEQATRLSYSDIEKSIQTLQKRGFLCNLKGTVKPTAKGHQFLNSVLEEFI